MSNVQLSWDNAVEDGVIFSNVLSGDASRLATSALSDRWVFSGTGLFDAELTGTPTIALVALCSHNFTLSATVRVRGYSAGLASLLYDSGTILAWPTGVTAASREGLRWNFIHQFSTPTAVAVLKIEINDGTNPAGFNYVGRLFAGKRLWQPTVNMLAGAGLGFESNSESQKALNGAEWFTNVEAHRVARFGLQVPDSEMLASGFDLQRMAAGPRRELVFQYDPADTVHAVRRSMFGRLRALSPIEEPYFGRMKTAFEVKELL